MDMTNVRIPNHRSSSPRYHPLGVGNTNHNLFNHTASYYYQQRKRILTWLRQQPYYRSVIGIVLIVIVILQIGGTNHSNQKFIRSTVVALYDRPVSNKDSIPYPNPNRRVSVILMNHGRPGLLLQSSLLSTFLFHPNVNEIILCHSNRHTMFNNSHLLEQYTMITTAAIGIEQKKQNRLQLQYQQQQQFTNNIANFNNYYDMLNNKTFVQQLLDAKIKHIDAIEMNAKHGLALRFHYCSTGCSSEWVIHVDDDMEIDTTTINELLFYMEQNSQRIVGYYGRRYNYWKRPVRHGYDTKIYTGQTVEVILTKLLILERRICQEFFNYTHLIENDFIPYSKPKWNGEDIFINLIANHYYNVSSNGPYNNYAIENLHVWESNVTNTVVQQHLYDRDRTPNMYEFQNQQIRNSNQNKDSSVDVSGNLDRKSIFNTDIVSYGHAIMKAIQHARYRGRLWYYTKQRLIDLRRNET